MRQNAGFALSKTSSQVTTRSCGGIAAVGQLSSVALPAWVPTETATFSLATMGREELRRLRRQAAETDRRDPSPSRLACPCGHFQRARYTGITIREGEAAPIDSELGRLE